VRVRLAVAKNRGSSETLSTLPALYKRAGEVADCGIEGMTTVGNLFPIPRYRFESAICLIAANTLMALQSFFFLKFLLAIPAQNRGGDPSAQNLTLGIVLPPSHAATVLCHWPDL
jgi:hypothetical protein